MNRFDFSASVHARALSDKPGDVSCPVILGGLSLAAATAIHTLAGSWTLLRQVHREPKGPSEHV